MLLGNYENMNGSLRLDIIESDNLIVFINFCCGDFAFDNLAENAVHNYTSFLFNHFFNY
jgi:hypothetical protein